MLSAQAIEAAPKTPSGVQSPRPARFGARSDVAADSPTAPAPSAPALRNIRRERPERSVPGASTGSTCSGRLKISRDICSPPSLEDFFALWGELVRRSRRSPLSAKTRAFPLVEAAVSVGGGHAQIEGGRTGRIARKPFFRSDPGRRAKRGIRAAGRRRRGARKRQGDRPRMRGGVTGTGPARAVALGHPTVTSSRDRPPGPHTWDEGVAVAVRVANDPRGGRGDRAHRSVAPAFRRRRGRRPVAALQPAGPRGRGRRRDP